MSFVRAANPIWYFVDLTGNQLNDTYYLFTLSNQFPFLPSPVYEQPDGSVLWSDPIQFLPNGTLPDNIFFDPALTYRLEIRAGNTQAAQLIYLIENFVPGSGGSPTPASSTGNVSNLIFDPQFYSAQFTNPLTLPGSGTVNISPGWQLVLAGGGTGTVTQVITNGTDENPPAGNPPYYLEFNLNGYSSAILQQQFNNLGNLFSNRFVSMSILAKSNDNVARAITLQYTEQSPGTTTNITTASDIPGAWSTIQGAVQVGQSGNTNSNFTSFVLMQIVLPGTGITDISNVQVVPQTAALAIPFVQNTIEQQIAQQFAYYQNSIQIQPKNTILTGWNFSLNPFQFITTALTTAASTTAYVADQTILVQKATSSVSTGQSAVGTNQGLQVQYVAAANNFALIQYIDPATIRPYWNQILSSLAAITASTGAAVNIKMRLIWRTSLPSTIGNAEPILSWAGKDPVFSAGWTAISPINDPEYILVPNVQTNFDFNGFQLPAASTSAMTLGIVIYTTTNMTVGGHIVFNRVSLVPNQFAIDSSPLTFDDELRRCQFYYEKTYDQGVLPGTASQGASSAQVYQMCLPTGAASGNSAFAVYPTGFEHFYFTVKRAAPSQTTFYNPGTGSANGGIALIRRAATTVATANVSITNAIGFANSGTKIATFIQSTTTPPNPAAWTSTGVSTFAYNDALSGHFQYHLTLNSCLGNPTLL